jgi:hypothetical protein
MRMAMTTTTSEIQGPVVVEENGDLFFSPNDLIRFELARYKLDNARKDVMLREFEISEEEHQHREKIQKMRNEEMILSNRLKKMEMEFGRIRALIEDSYKIDLSKIAFDQITGKITHLWVR